MTRVEAVPPLAEVRVDRWLWAARIFKTRSLAARACSAGHVRCNDHPAKPAKLVRCGDRLAVTLTGRGERLLRVLGLGERRGPATVARTLYEDETPLPPAAPAPPAAWRDRGAGRPTKRDRRRLRALRGR